MMTITKMYCATLSLKWRRKYLESFGNNQNTMRQNNRVDMPNLIQYAEFISPLVVATITARISKEAVTVMIVPAMVMLTARFLDIPILLTIG